VSELRIEDWEMPAAHLGPDSPLPPLQRHRDVHASIRARPDIPKEIVRNMSYGRVPNAMPYGTQDDYDRRLRPRVFHAAVLENDILRATFMPELGGRLWSLVHKPSGRELLYVNSVFQPANLAIRNAWFCGGVEWNIGIIGHSPFTCSPLFAARVEGPDGTPVLRLYEWERIREVPFQIDAYLPDNSPVLLVRVRIANPHDHEVPMYWWSNIAASEQADTRVVVPADAAIGMDPDGAGLALVTVPVFEGVDRSYPARLDRAGEQFFNIPNGCRPWIAALDGDGRGLVQTSTARLKSRKLFHWGTARGGKNWQKHLSPQGGAYFEIQAGLAQTQMEHLPMPARSTWEWLEAYGLLEVDPQAVHGQWAGAQNAVATGLESLIPNKQLDAELERGRLFADRRPAEILQCGSGWGKLEGLRRQAAGEPPFCSAATPFDEGALDEQQHPWAVLLHTGAFPDVPADAVPRGYLVGGKWRKLLEDALKSGSGANWLAWLYAGVMRYHDGEHEGAQEAWKRSLELAETPWALRNLALAAEQEERFDEAAEFYVAACRMRPDILSLAVECGRFLKRSGRAQQFLDLLEQLAPAVRASGRARFIKAEAALDVGDLARVEVFFADRVVPSDMREGERSLSDLWFAYHERRAGKESKKTIDRERRAAIEREHPVPDHLDFRMKP